MIRSIADRWAGLLRGLRSPRVFVLLAANLLGSIVLVLIFLSFDYDYDLSDGYAYWNAWAGGLYDLRWLEHHAYVYSPAFAQVLWPFSHLPWEVFDAGWMAAQIGVAIWLIGPAALAAIMLLPGAGFVRFTIERGNLHLLLTGAVVLAMSRWPAAWAFVLHTKPTMGVALAWYVGRRDWRGLGIALGTSAAIAAVSFVIAPHLWFDWAGILIEGSGESPTGALAFRLLVAGLLAYIAGLTAQRWPVPIATFIAAPTIWIGSSEVMFFGAVYLAWLDWRAGRLLRIRDWRTPGSSRSDPHRSEHEPVAGAG